MRERDRKPDPRAGGIARRTLLTETGLALACLSIACLSVACQTFHFGIVNNEYHIPIALKLFDEPNFLSNAYYRTLRSYASVFWSLTSLVATERNIGGLFLGFHLVARALTLFAAALVVRELGVTERRNQLFVVAFLGLSLAFIGGTALSDHDLFRDYFTHTEIANALLLLTLVALLRGSAMVAFVLVGLTIDTNAFAGIWAGLLSTWVLFAPREPGEPVAARIRRLAGPALVGVVVAWPTIYWVATSTSRPPAGLDYTRFLAGYYPYHFFIAAATPSAVLELVVKVVAAFAAAAVIRRAAGRGPAGITVRRWLGAACALFAVGIVLPYLTGWPFALNLHLLRVDGVIQLTAIVLALTAVIVRAESEERSRLGTRAMMCVLAGLVFGAWALAAWGLVLMALRPTGRRTLAALGLGAAALAAIATAAGIALVPDTAAAGNAAFALAALYCVAGRGRVRAWVPAALAGLVAVALALGFLTERLFGAAVSSWLLQNRAAVLPAGLVIAAIAAVELRNPVRPLLPLLRPVTLVALLALSAVRLATNGPKGDSAEQWAAWDDMTSWVRRNTAPDARFLVYAYTVRDRDFQWLARRAEWVDWKMGAAVMWAPSYWTTWSERYRLRQAATDLQSRVRLACAEGIDFLVLDRFDGDVQFAYRNDFYALLPVLCGDRR